VISWGGDKPFVSTATSIAPRTIKSGNSQISFFMVLIEGSVPLKTAGWQVRRAAHRKLDQRAMIFARADFVNVLDLTHLRGLRGKRFTSTANSTARNRVWRVNAVHANLRFNPRKKGIHTISQEPPAVARRIAGESVPQLSQ